MPPVDPHNQPTDRQPVERRPTPADTDAPSVVDSIALQSAIIVNATARPAGRWSPVAGRLARWLAAAALLAAAGLKAYAPLTGRPIAEALPGTPYTDVLLILAELALAVWLVGGYRPRAAHGVTTAVFALFAIVSASKAVLGHASCGCFGDFRMNPWITAAVDASVVALLILTRPAAAEPPKMPMTPAGPHDGVKRQQLSRLKGSALALGLLIGGLLGGLFVAPQPTPLMTPELPAGPIVLLEPDRWVSMRLPLLDHVTIDAELSVGTWLVVLVRDDCERCGLVLPRIAAMSRRPVNPPRVAILRLPPLLPTGEQKLGRGASWTVGTLPESRQWFAPTPVAIWIRDGAVQSIDVELSTPDGE